MCVTSVMGVKIQWPKRESSFLLSASFVWAALDWSPGCMQVSEEYTLSLQQFGLEVGLQILSLRNLYYFTVGESQLLVASLRNLWYSTDSWRERKMPNPASLPSGVCVVPWKEEKVIPGISEGKSLSTEKTAKSAERHSGKFCLQRSREQHKGRA